MNNKIKIKIICRNPKEFLKEIIKRKMNIYDIKLNKESLVIIILNRDLKRIKEIKYIHKVKIIDYYGFSKIKYFIKKNKVVLFLIVLGIAINILLSNIIFEIKINTPDKKLEKIIIKDLKDNNINKYHFKLSSKNKNQAKKNIILKEHDKIEWLEIKEQGTKYIIEVQERKINNKAEKCNSRNIVSRKTAVITRINAEEGEILKKTNDVVFPNEVLISGLIYNKEKITSKKCAKGKVYGEVWYKVRLTIPRIIKQKKKTNNHSYGIYIKLFKNEFNIGNKYKTYTKKRYDIIRSRIIPIELSVCKYSENKITNVVRNLNDVEDYAIEIATKKVNKQLSNPNVISKKVLKKQVKNSKIIVDVFISVEEDITTYQDISSIDIEKINQERE